MRGVTALLLYCPYIVGMDLYFQVMRTEEKTGKR